MDNLPLGKLPPELRNEIARLALVNGEWPIDLRLIRYANGLTQTCQQVRRETRAMFWSMNRFRLHVTSSRDRKWRQMDIITNRLRDLLGSTLGFRIVGPILQLKVQYIHPTGKAEGGSPSFDPTPWHEVLTIDGFFDHRLPPSPNSTQLQHKITRRTDVQGSSSTNVQWIVQQYLDLGLNLQILEEQCQLPQWIAFDQSWANKYIGHLAVLA